MSTEDDPYLPVMETPYAAIAAVILASTERALRKSKYTDEEIRKYLTEAKSGDYNHLVAVTEKWIEQS